MKEEGATYLGIFTIRVVGELGSGVGESPRSAMRIALSTADVFYRLSPSRLTFCSKTWTAKVLVDLTETLATCLIESAFPPIGTVTRSSIAAI